MKNILLGAIGAVVLCSLPAAAHEACHPKGDQNAADKVKPAAASDGAVILRGEKLKGAPAVSLADLVQSPEKHSGKTVLVEANVRRACTRKGCWMELASDDKSTGVRVTFKDYGFFVPLDSAGAKARVEGEVKVVELSEKDAQHLQSEGATVPRGKDGQPREVQLVATGVELRR